VKGKAITVARAPIKSISIRKNIAGSNASTYSPTSGNSIDDDGTISFNNIPFVWTANTSYVIRVTATTAFYYEMVATSPFS
jgi:hypothetical protein